MLYNLFEDRDFVSVFAVALLAEGVDRNFSHEITNEFEMPSPSSRRAWIEISKTFAFYQSEGVDRNVLAGAV